MKYNITLDKDRKPDKEMVKHWANQKTDEKFTALHFATFHANFEMIQILIEQMEADLKAVNMYGANVLHIAA